MDEMDELQLVIDTLLEVDTDKSKDSIKNKDIPKINALLTSDKKTRVNITAALNIKESKRLIQSQLNTISNGIDSPKINLNVSIDKKAVNTANNIGASIKEVGNNASHVEKEVNKLASQIETYKTKLQGLSKDWSKQGIYVDEVEVKATNLLNTINNIDSIGAFNDWIHEFNTLTTQTTQLKQNLDNQVRVQKEIYKLQIEQQRLDKDKNPKQFTELHNQVALKQNELKILQEQGIESTKLISNEQQQQYILAQTLKEQNKFKVAIGKTIDQQLKLKNAEQASYETTVRKADVLKSQVQAYKTANPKAKKMFGSDLDDLIYQLEIAPEKVDEIKAKFMTLKGEIRSTGKEGKTFGQSVKDAAEKFGSWMTLTGVISGAWRNIQKMVINVVELDSAMTNLKKVTDETEISYNKFFKDIANQAKDLKIDLSNLINQTAEWAKKGYNLSESSTLSRASGIYSVVGEVDNTTAVQDITTVMKSYNMAVEESMDIVDKFNNISNNYSVSAADIGEMLSNSISSLAIAGNNLDQAIAMGTTITEITGDASEAGNTMKVLSMRLRGATTEIEQAGESTDGMAESTSKLREKILALTNIDGKGGFDIMADADNFKSTYDIMLGISNVWQDMSDVDQASLIEIIAGKQRGNTVSALLTNMSQANNIFNDSLNSSGSAMKEYSLYLDSIEGKMQGFKTGFESLSKTVIDSDFIKSIVDIGTKFVNVLDKIIDKFGLLKTLGLTAATALSFKNVGELLNTPVYAQPQLICA